MKTALLLYPFLFFFGDCSNSKTSIDKLHLRENKYYITGEKPFTGKVIIKFENGDISNIIEMKEGIPNGKWIAYGYKGEIIQEGQFIPIEAKDLDHLANNNISRLNICIYKEGEKTFSDIYLVGKNLPGNENDKNIKHRLITFLKEHSISISVDSLNEIKYVSGELNN